MMRMSTRQRGLTMIELLVAVALSAVIALAAVAALVVSRRGFTSVDAASQLRDNARFASSLVQRIAGQTGFLDWQFAMAPRSVSTDLPDPDPNVTGFNNSLMTNPSNPVSTAANNNRSGACSTAGGCSDILIVRYQAQSIPGTTLNDNTMIDCGGAALGAGLTPPPTPPFPANRDDVGVSVFYVADYKNEPALMCSFGVQVVAAGPVATYTWSAAPVPIVQGVENFQVLYGVDGIVANTALNTTLNNDSVPEQYLRADQMVVTGNPSETNKNWRRVRSIRIGMVLRGPVGSQQERSAQLFYPFGLARDSASGTAGWAMSTDDVASSADKGTRYTAPADGRLRQTSTFTVHLRNDQGLCIGSSCTVQN